MEEVVIEEERARARAFVDSGAVAYGCLSRPCLLMRRPLSLVLLAARTADHRLSEPPEARRNRIGARSSFETGQL